MILRVAANLISIFGLIILPWWGACLVLIIFLVIFDFAEIVVYGIMLNIIYGSDGSIFSKYGFAIVSIILYAISVYIRPYLKAV